MRRILAIAILAAMPLAALDLPRLRLPFIDREPIARAFDAYPDRGPWWPDYPRFLQAVRDRTKPGDSIAIVVPAEQWEGGQDGYAYAYYRASWFLIGRQVLPVIWRDGRPLPENVARADYIAVWRRPARSARPVVMQQFGGTLLGR